MSQRFQYLAYGLRLDVNRSIPILVSPPVPAEADVSIEFKGTLPFPYTLEPRAEWYSSPQRNAAGEPQLSIQRVDAPDGVRFVQLRFGGSAAFATFTIRHDATQVWVSWMEGAQFEDIAWLLLRPVMSMILWLRGITCLHASVVAANDGAVLFVGGNGAGKSSMGAAFASRGYAVLADDVAVLTDEGEHFVVQPTYPTLALWQHTARAVLGATDLPPLWAGEEKRYVSLATQQGATSFQFQAQPLPLAAIYFLGARNANDTEPSITPVTAADGLVRLLANRYLREFPANDRRIRQFELLSRVAKHVPLRELRRPNDLTTLSRICEMVIQDVSTQTKPLQELAT